MDLGDYNSIIGGNSKNYGGLIKLLMYLLKHDDSGSIKKDKLNHHFAALAYDSYNKEDKVENILFINSWNRNYYLIKTQAELLKAIGDKDIKISGGITWNDEQQKATPQYARA